MIRRKVVGIAVLPIVLAIAGVLAVTHAQSKGGSLTAQDYAEIQQLHSRYAIGVDSGNAELFASAFTEDGTLILSGRTFQGRQQLAQMAGAPGPDKGPMNVSHVVTNVLIEPSTEGATGTAYFIRMTIGKDGKPSTVDGGGVYQDTFVKTAAGWRIKKRTGTRAHTKVE
jgi:hypothetical protein